MSSDEISIENDENMAITTNSISMSTVYGVNVNDGEFKINTSLKLGTNVPILDSVDMPQYKSTSLGILPVCSNSLSNRFLQLFIYEGFWSHTASVVGTKNTASGASNLYHHHLMFSYSGVSNNPEKQSHYQELLKIWRAYNAGEPTYIHMYGSGGGGTIDSGTSVESTRNANVESMSIMKDWKNQKVTTIVVSITYYSTNSNTSFSEDLSIFTQPVIGKDGEFYDKNLEF
jgi:hypothetical protein